MDSSQQIHLLYFKYCHISQKSHHTNLNEKTTAHGADPQLANHPYQVKWVFKTGFQQWSTHLIENLENKEEKNDKKYHFKPISR